MIGLTSVCMFVKFECAAGRCSVLFVGCLG